jgi:putative spermidine/putrescine transport system permease protein
MTSPGNSQLHPLERSARNRYRAMLVPAFLLLGVFFVLPLMGMAGRSLFVKGHVTVSNYALVFGDSIYFLVIALTFRMAGIVTLACVIIGYPVAYALAHASRRVTSLLLIAVILPYFTSVIVRTYAWMILLGREGLINQYLTFLGFKRAELLYTEVGVVIGMIYVLLPLMVLTLLTVMRGIDQRLIRAALSLGASPWYAFRRIYLPLSVPGIAAGALLVFILAVGFYITPALMGGSDDVTIAMLIQREVEMNVNWPFASALAMTLLAVTLAAFWIYSRFIRLESLLKAAA